MKHICIIQRNAVKRPVREEGFYIKWLKYTVGELLERSLRILIGALLQKGTYEHLVLTSGQFV